VNVTPRDLLQEDFLAMIDLALTGAGVDPAKLDIEIIESALIDDEETVQRVIRGLHSRNITVTIDDFGTGYSSFGYFKKFAIDGLKIDRSFMVDIGDENSNAVAIVEAIMAMARALGLVVTAEGIENETQFNLLKNMNCDEIQGYYVSKPIPMDEFINLLEKYNGKR